MRSVHRRYTIEFVPAMLAYVLIMLFAWPCVSKIQCVPLRGVAALLPESPAVFNIHAIFRQANGADELERRISLERLAIATTVVGVVSFAAGFLAIAKVFDAGAEILTWVLAVLLGVYGCARLLPTARYSRS